jgi:hypothetical protein
MLDPPYGRFNPSFPAAEPAAPDKGDRGEETPFRQLHPVIAHPVVGRSRTNLRHPLFPAQIRLCGFGPAVGIAYSGAKDRGSSRLLLLPRRADNEQLFASGRFRTRRGPGAGPPDIWWPATFRGACRPIEVEHEIIPAGELMFKVT